MTILYRVDDDDPDDRGRPPRTGRRTPRWWRVGRLLLTVAVAGGFVFAIVTIYDDGGGTPQTSDVPVVETNLAETRVRPAQPGGMDVPHRDRVILQRGPTEDAELLATALLQAPAEEPLPDEALPTPSDTPRVGRDDPSVPEVLLERLPPGAQPANPPAAEPPLADIAPAELVLSPPAPVEAPDPPPAADEVLEVDALADLIAAVQQAEVEPAEAPTAAEPTIDELIDTVSDRDFRVQLAALRDEAAVTPEWRRLVRLYPDLLEGQDPLTSEPEPGRLIRVSAGPLSEADARELCGAIAERGGDCFVRAIN